MESGVISAVTEFAGLYVSWGGLPWWTFITSCHGQSVWHCRWWCGHHLCISLWFLWSCDSLLCFLGICPSHEYLWPKKIFEDTSLKGMGSLLYFRDIKSKEITWLRPSRFSWEAQMSDRRVCAQFPYGGFLLEQGPCWAIQSLGAQGPLRPNKLPAEPWHSEFLPCGPLSRPSGGLGWGRDRTRFPLSSCAFS